MKQGGVLFQCGINIKTFKEYVRSQPCIICGSGYWDINKGQWRNTVSHVKKRSTRNDQPDFDNCVSMCFNCHEKYERESPITRERFREEAKRLTIRYGEIYE